MNANLSDYERKYDVNHQYTICEVCGDEIAKEEEDD